MTVGIGSYTIGQQEWKRVPQGWVVRMWGWHPNSHGAPSWRWVAVEEHRVPTELKERYKQDANV